jgi:para-aminobenzoate synthetase component I
MDVWAKEVNRKAYNKEAFLFLVNYSLTQAYIFDTNQALQNQVFYAIGLHNNFPFQNYPPRQVLLSKQPIPFGKYKKAFATVQGYLHRGDSFLVNLTQPTPVISNLSLQEIFEFSRAKYQLYFQDKFVTFSPETFVKITDGIISTFPMKGTISAQVPNAEYEILHNRKEMAEHSTIVDLLRNDLSTVANKVWVERYRYIDRLPTQAGDLLQVSSEIKGVLQDNWQAHLGDILLRLLPAGSICGAPKTQTLKIIAEAEAYNRGFYTGIMGFFDGQNLDSGVMIRFIEKTKQGLVFKSGGGITAQSLAENEYLEMIEKIYVPILG